MEYLDFRFDRPVIILAAPRSGSTLLFELLAKARNVWTINNESHAVFESIPHLNPQLGSCNSNRLEADDATLADVELIRQRFYSMLQNRDTEKYSGLYDLPRFLEKTPKNALRVPYLNEMFPDALYIFLYRNPRENISSIMDAWKSQKFVTYRNLKGRSDSWSLLLPPGWERMHNKPLEDIACFQWKTTNNTVMKDLQSLIPKDRWVTVSYSRIVNDTERAIEELCAFCDFEYDDVLGRHCRSKLPASRYTLSAPSSTKWHRHALELSRVISSTAGTLRNIRKIERKPLDIDFDTDIPEALTEQRGLSVDSGTVKVGRNSPCPCGSGLKYKKCHGKM